MDLAKAMQNHIEQASKNLPTPHTGEADWFCPISLGDWLDLCRQTGVPHVGAEKVATLLRDDCLRFDTKGEHQDRLGEAFEKIQEAAKPYHMLRFDCCSGLNVKMRMAQGQPQWNSEFNDLVLDDPRAFDIIFEFPREELPVWRRPWTDPIVYDNYPAEYRVFVRDGEIAGISNYYPQRPLIEFKGHLATLREYTTRLAEAAPQHFLWPMSHRPDSVTEDGVHFTADFMATSNGILFLEGGPPHEMGAHPCCFQPGRIEGVALADRNETPIY